MVVGRTILPKKLVSKVVFLDGVSWASATITIAGTKLNNLQYYINNRGGNNSYWQQINFTFNGTKTTGTATITFNSSGTEGIYYNVVGTNAILTNITIQPSL